MSDWVPDQGDLIWIHFDPQVGREQGGHRPALVLSPARYNRQVGLLVCVPLTTKGKGYAFEFAISDSPPSVALVDHIKSLDWRSRKASPKGRVTEIEFATVQARLRRLIGSP